MKNLFLALLVAMVAPAFGQVAAYTDPVAEQTYTVIQQQTATPIEEIKNTGGIALTLYDDGVSNPIDLPFEFYFYGNPYDSVFVSQNGFISFTSNANGCCSGNALPFFSDNPYYNMNNSIFGMWSDLADFNNPGNPYYQSFNDRFVVGWYGVDELGTSNKFTYEITLFSNNDFSINYGSFDYLGPTGRTFTSGFQGDQAGESYQIYNGNNPSGLQNTTYYVQSSEVVPIPEPEQPIAPDCNINPTDPTCIINSIIDDQEETYFADENSGFDDGSDDGGSVFEEEEEQDIAIEEETFVAAEDPIEEETFTEEPESLEEMLADDDSADESLDSIEETLVAKELNDEQKSNELADSIATNVLEAALAIAADTTALSIGGSSGSPSSSTNNAASAASNQTVESAIEAIESATQSESTTSETLVFASTTESVQETTAAAATTSDASDLISSDLSSADALDILETGRALGQESLLATMSMTEMAATESMNQAESVAVESSSESLVASAASVAETAIVASFETQEQQQSNEVETSNIESSIQEQAEQNNETLVADTSMEQTQETVSFEVEQVAESMIPQQSQDFMVETQTEEVVVADTNVIESSNEMQDTSMMVENTQEEQQSAVEFTTVEQTMEMFAENINSQVQSEQEELENSIIQQAIASSQQSEDNNSMGFAEAEAMTIANDPALANAFNVQPNTASLELLGVLGSAGQEKSDAELRAEQVVAANKEEQDAINANYMEADQSGILAAIGSETDVSAYRTAMLRDNNVWYKPEDIYKGVIIKDNVRGSYFLEKGNTDTYKKMVEEQYK
jgi:hypothetical protein